MEEKEKELTYCRKCKKEIDTTKEYAVALVNCIYINSNKEADLEGAYYHSECLDEMKSQNIESEEE